MTVPSPPLRIAVLTPRGRGAIASLRLCGDIALLNRELQPASGRPLIEQPAGRILFGHWGGNVPEDIVFCRCDATTWEIHCHGGEAAVARIVDDCVRAGAIVLSWQELLAHSTDILTAELREALSRAVTWRTAEYLLSQGEGRLRSAVETLEEIEWNDAGRQEIGRRLDELLRWSQFGRHLTEPWRIVLTGSPNVGKSSLMNALLGYRRSIVFDQPGTTRDVLTAGTAFDGWPVELTDTAGIRDSAHSLEAEGISRAKQAIATADLVLQVIDIHAEPHAVTPMVSDNGLEVGSREILVAQKCDLNDCWGARLPATALKVSAQTGQGLEALQAEIVRRLIPEVPPLERPLPITHRQRELLLRMRRYCESDREREDFAAAAMSLTRTTEIPAMPASSLEGKSFG